MPLVSSTLTFITVFKYSYYKLLVLITIETYLGKSNNHGKRGLTYFLTLLKLVFSNMSFCNILSVKGILKISKEATVKYAKDS